MRTKNNCDIENYIQTELLKLRDVKYREFNARLIPDINPRTIIGVRTPALRKFSKELTKNPEYQTFLDILPHKYYEENNLHGFLIENIKDYSEVIYRLEKFFPYIDNWATCDLIRPKIFKKHLPELLIKIKEWIRSDHVYTIRFAAEMLMSFYLDDNFSEEHLKIVSEIKSDAYYVKMMIAWYFATALAKQYTFAIKYIEEKKLAPWIHNKTIQKAMESLRISNDKKDYLKTFKIKQKNNLAC